jgi:hypothetical protein
VAGASKNQKCDSPVPHGESAAWMPLGAAGSRNKRRQWILHQMKNNSHLCWFCLISSDRDGACAYVPDDILIFEAMFLPHDRQRSYGNDEIKKGN